jgi:hypothetical protein
MTDMRTEIAASHGLPQEAATLLTGDTIDELETSAQQLTQLMRTHGRQAEPTPADPITAALQANHQRKRHLAETIIGRHPRNERGQFTPRQGGFDGGARPLAPTPRDPMAEHNQAIAELTRRRTLGAWREFN